MLKLGASLLSLLCHKALTVSFLSAAGADAEKEAKKRSAKKAFEINFDEDIDFEAYFRKTKVCAEVLPLSALSFAISVCLGTVIWKWFISWSCETGSVNPTSRMFLGAGSSDSRSHYK